MHKVIPALLSVLLITAAQAGAAAGDVLIYKGKPGDLRHKYLFEHAAVDSGNGYVYEFLKTTNLPESSRARVVRTPLNVFKKRIPRGVTPEVITPGNFHTRFPGVPPQQHPALTVAMAENIASVPGRNFGRYHLATNNCQDFVMYVKTGQHGLSWQRDLFRRGGSLHFSVLPGANLLTVPQVAENFLSMPEVPARLFTVPPGL